VSLKIKNIGKQAGSEVVQLYINDEEASVDRPTKELKSFRKVYLNEGEQKEISFTLNAMSFSFYDVESSNWKIEPGVFNLFLGSSSEDIRQKGRIVIKE
jgi:beta-glucosidase